MWDSKKKAGKNDKLTEFPDYYLVNVQRRIEKTKRDNFWAYNEDDKKVAMTYYVPIVFRVYS